MQQGDDNCVETCEVYEYDDEEGQTEEIYYDEEPLVEIDEDCMDGEEDNYVPQKEDAEGR